MKDDREAGGHRVESKERKFQGFVNSYSRAMRR